MKFVRFEARGELVSLKNNKALGNLKESKRGKAYREIINNSDVVSYQKFFLPQIPWHAQAMFDEPVRVLIKAWYCTERPDLDEAIVLDLMQAQYTKDPRTKKRLIVRRGVYTNDRLVRERHVYHGIDRKNPRIEIIVMPIERVADSTTALLETHIRAVREINDQIADESAKLNVDDPRRAINYARARELF